MNAKRMFDKFTRNNKKTKKGFAVIEPGAVYLSCGINAEDDAVVPIAHNNWQEAFNSALQAKDNDISHITIIISDDYYQIFQIDKPAVPKSEWSIALPFLLKDLIKEKSQDIVADAIELPANKIQSYVIAKKFLYQLLDILTAKNIQLDALIPEEEVWKYSAGELTSFLLLRKAIDEPFKLGAYSEHAAIFHRTIRSVSGVLTGDEANPLQLDGLALELQRSIDYLFSQMKGKPLNNLKLCCEGENEGMLADELNQRINIRVSGLEDNRDSPPKSGEVLLHTISQAPLTSINLFPPHLRPKKEWLTLPNVALGWGIVLLGMVVTFAYFKYHSHVIDSQISVVRLQETELNKKIKDNQLKLQKHQPSAAKLAAVERLKRDIKAKQDSLSAVGQYSASQTLGYSGVMRSLAAINRKDIAITHISMVGNALNIRGLAKNASVVPSWITEFKTQLNLIGRTFEKVKIGRNDKDIVTFELSSKDEVSGK